MNSNALENVRAKRKAYQRYLQAREGQNYLAYTKSPNLVKPSCMEGMREYDEELAADTNKTPILLCLCYEQNENYGDDCRHG